jgi:hypothetical protein
MKNYTIVLSLFVLLLSTQIATSQNHGKNSQSNNRNSNSVESIEKQMVKIQEKLGLDGLQAVLVERILQKYANEKKQLRNLSDSGDVMRAKMRDLNIKRNDELSEILTEEQITLLNKTFKEPNNQRNSQSKKGSGKGSGKGKGSRRF